MEQDTCIWNNTTSLVAKALMETTRIMATEMENTDQKLEQINHPRTIYVNYIKNKIWMTFDFVTQKGTIEEKALIDSGANENMIDLRMAHKLGLTPQKLE
jgi:hypothetical protein